MDTGRNTGSRDADILLARRIDWRFLLPTPALNRVLYIGPADDELCRALQRFSRQLEVTAPARRSDGPTAANGPFDLLVVADSSLSSVAQGLPSLAAGGHVYWEIHRLPGRRAGPWRIGWRHAGHYAALLADLGVAACTAHWHRPDFERCKELVPFASRTALRHAVGRPGASLSGRLKFLTAIALLRSGLLYFVTPSLSVVGTKPLPGPH